MFDLGDKPICGLMCEIVGCIVIFTYILKILNWVYINFCTAADLKKRYQKAGDWAVVTGASDGIGRAMAIDLAKRGFKVCIIARTRSKLEEVEKQIKERGSEAKIVEFDFATASDKEYNTLFQTLDAISGLAILVNNVGVNYEHPMFFETVDVAEDCRLIKVNCEAQVRMSKWALKRMKSQRCGGIVSLSSMFGGLPSPLLSTYGGTKAFNHWFSMSLGTEASKFGVDSLTVAPGMVCSSMSKRKYATFDCPAAAAMAKQSLNKLSLTSYTEGHRHHEIMNGIASLFPTSLVKIAAYSLNYGVMKKAEKKKAAAPASQ